MHVTFRDRKHRREIDSSFTLYDGKLPSQELWMVGDEVSIIFEINDAIREAIQEFALNDTRTIEAWVHLPCIVVRRSHCLAWKSTGKMECVGTGHVTLEAISGDWEDILIWIITGKNPNPQPEAVE
jgi:hypothetical protein